MLSIWLIALHMLGDYVLQTPYMAANKFKSAAVRSVHVLLYSLPLGLFAGVWVRLHGLPVWHSAAFFVGLYVTHWITDMRRWCSDDPLSPQEREAVKTAQAMMDMTQHDRTELMVSLSPLQKRLVQRFWEEMVFDADGRNKASLTQRYKLMPWCAKPIMVDQTTHMLQLAVLSLLLV